MQSKDVFIGLDIGTQSTKAVLYHPSSQRILARSGCPYDLDDPGSNNPFRKEQHPHKWIKALHVCFKDLSTSIKENELEVKGIGVSGQQHGMVTLDNQFHVVRTAKLWCDVEASAQAKEFSENSTKIMRKIFDDETYTWTIPAGYTAPKVLWMKQHEPTLFEKVRWIILPHDYINLCLKTGLGHDMNSQHEYDNFIPGEIIFDESIHPTTDPGDASGTGILHPCKPQYVSELANLVDKKYEKSLPKILKPNAISGYLSPLWKKILGIDIDIDIDPNQQKKQHLIPISAGSGDNMMSALGTGLVYPGCAMMSLGTSGTIFGVSECPVKTGTPVATFNDATGKYLPLVCVMSCTDVLNRVLKEWCSTNEKNLSHLEATMMAENVPPGCYGLIFLPFLGGERTPDWPESTGALLGLNAQNMNCMAGGSPGVMYRAALEGITYVLADALGQMRKACGNGFNPKFLYVVGGGSKNHLWRQILADVLGLELIFPIETESAALGAAFQAGAAACGEKCDEYVAKQNIRIEGKHVKPTSDKSKLLLYQKGFEKYLEYSRNLFSKH